jgi:hypothetical protein
MKNLLILLSVVLLSSCSSYTRIQGERVTHVLAITENGDTIQVPMNQLRREVQPDYYNNWQFYWGNNWYWGNVWYPHYFSPYRYRYWDDWYWRNPRVYTPVPPRRESNIRREQISPRRVTPSTPRSYTPTPRREFVPQQPRTTPTQPRTPNRGYTPSRGNSNGSPVIRQQVPSGGTPTRGGVIKQN